MSKTYNYVATAHKPTAVSHSCVGNFTSPDDFNLIIAKFTLIEIHRYHDEDLQLMLDVPIYGRILTLEIFRPHDETKDLLFIVMENLAFCILQWHADGNELITRVSDTCDVYSSPTKIRQIGIIDPAGRLYGFHLDNQKFLAFPGTCGRGFKTSLAEVGIVDIKFLYGCEKPTIAVLAKDEGPGSWHVKTYRFSMHRPFSDGPWSQSNLNKEADLLIPVPPPCCGVLIIGAENIAYRGASAFEELSTHSIIKGFKAYGRVDADGSRYLLGDFSGRLYLLVIAHENEKVTGLAIKLLGQTAIASSISYVADNKLYVGSYHGDSQACKSSAYPAKMFPAN